MPDGQAGLASAGPFAARCETAVHVGGPAPPPGLPRLRRRRPEHAGPLISAEARVDGGACFCAGGSRKAFWDRAASVKPRTGSAGQVIKARACETRERKVLIL